MYFCKYSNNKGMIFCIHKLPDMPDKESAIANT